MVGFERHQIVIMYGIIFGGNGEVCVWLTVKFYSYKPQPNSGPKHILVLTYEKNQYDMSIVHSSLRISLNPVVEFSNNL